MGAWMSEPNIKTSFQTPLTFAFFIFGRTMLSLPSSVAPNIKNALRYCLFSFLPTHPVKAKAIVVCWAAATVASIFMAALNLP